jgi:hypothetical protein
MNEETCPYCIHPSLQPWLHILESDISPCRTRSIPVTALPCLVAYCSRLCRIDSKYVVLYCDLSKTVTITTGGLPDGACSWYGVSAFEPSNRYSSPTTPRTIKRAVLLRMRRRIGGICDERCPKGGGLEFLRGGYAKCMSGEYLFGTSRIRYL